MRRFICFYLLIYATGHDINVLAELISSLPNAAPSSLLRSSALAALLMVSWWFRLQTFSFLLGVCKRVAISK
jgi:hypothetical protein